MTDGTMAYMLVLATVGIIFGGFMIAHFLQYYKENKKQKEWNEHEELKKKAEQRKFPPMFRIVERKSGVGCIYYMILIRVIKPDLAYNIPFASYVPLSHTHRFMLEQDEFVTMEGAIEYLQDLKVRKEEEDRENKETQENLRHQVTVYEED